MGNRVAQVDFEVLRPLTSKDLSAPLALAPVKPKPLAALRAGHHQLAQVLARGATDVEASWITGYAAGYISILKNDPAFQELLAHYGAVSEAVFVDVSERMKMLGLSSLEELQKRLAEEPEGWTKRELMDLSKLMLVDSQKALLAVSPGAGAGVAVSISFVAPEQVKTIDGTIERT